MRVLERPQNARNVSAPLAVLWSLNNIRAICAIKACCCLVVVLLLTCVPSRAELLKDVVYARVGGVALTLDVSVPDGNGPFPAAILVHGGGFVAGDKQQYIIYLFKPLADANFVWFSINYRLAPQYKFPAATDDVERAIRYVRENAKKYKVDASRIALIGESAGGHLVSYVGARNRPEARVAAVVSLYGIHDFVSRAVKMGGQPSEAQSDFLGVEHTDADTVSILVKASPVVFVRKEMPPFLLIHGKNDEEVPYDQSVEMCEKMKKVGAHCDLLTVDAGHGMDTWEPHPELHWYKKALVDWLRKTLQ